MKPSGIIGFVGVIGSGKSYAIDDSIHECINFNIDPIVGDFSDGVRYGVNRLLCCSVPINVNSESYRIWKDTEQNVLLPNGERVFITGRDLLTRYGTYMKELCGDDVWANWTKKDVLGKLIAFPDRDKYISSALIFGSVRYLCEAKVLFDLGKTTGKEVQIMFMDFHSSNYNPTFDHESEHFAQKLLKSGCVHGQDITQIVKEIIYG